MLKRNLRRLRQNPGYALFLLTLIICLTCDFYIARAQLPNADFTQNYREIFAIRDGNILLKNWVLTSDNFYFTDLPFYLLPSLFLGTSFAIIYVGPFLIFASLLITSLLIASRAIPQANARLLSLFTILFLFGIPFSPCTVFLLTGAIHNGAILFSLLAVLVAQPALMGQNFNKLRLIPFGLIIFAVTASDPLACSFCIFPFLLLVMLRAWIYRQINTAEWQFAVVTCLAVFIAWYFRGHITQFGGFFIRFNYNTDFIPSVDALIVSVHALLTGIRALFSASQPMLGPGPLMILVAAIRSVTALIVACLAVMIIWQAPARPHGNGVSQWLILGACVLFVLDCLSNYFNIDIILHGKFANTGTRFIIPAYIFLCLAAAIELPAIRLPRLCLWPTGFAAAIFFAAAVLQTIPMLSAPPAYQTTPEILVAEWLQKSGLTYGVGPYWTAELTQALAKSQVIVDPVRANDAQTAILPYEWVCDATSLAANRRPQFAIFPPDNAFGLSIADLTATYGPARQIFNVYGIYVMEFAP
jgi:hypothetical protein